MAAKTKRKRKGTWVRKGEILQVLRGQIIRGHYAPGTRVPTRDEMEKRFLASRVTIQRAFDALIREGFVEPRGRLGTFVSHTPPHLFRYGLVLPIDGQNPRFGTSLTRALVRRSRAISREGPDSVVVFPGIHAPSNVEDFERINEDVMHKRLAGLLFLGNPSAFDGCLLADDKRFPKVAITATPVAKGIPRVELDRAVFFAKALEDLADRRCRRVGVLVSGPEWSVDLAMVQTQIEDRGLTTEPRWIHRVDADRGRWVRSLMELMMRAPAKRRPDGLIVTEEVLMDDVTGGMRDAGQDAARNTKIVFQSFGAAPRNLDENVRPLGYDLHAVFQTCFTLASAVRNKNAGVPQLTQIRPAFPGV
jgi:hypothetical protein